MSTDTPYAAVDLLTAELKRLRAICRSYERDPLIAAAPDLLAALKEMVTWMPSGFAPQSQSIAMKMAHDAIAKAEGAS